MVLKAEEVSVGVRIANIRPGSKPRGTGGRRQQTGSSKPNQPGLVLGFGAMKLQRVHFRLDGGFTGWFEIFLYSMKTR